LLADAAGAAVLEASEDDSGILDVDLYSDGQFWNLLYMPAGGSRHPATQETVEARMHYAKMKGSEVFKVAVRMFEECATTMLARHGLTPNDLALFIPHQANLRIIEVAAKRLGMPMERVFVNIDRYGNTGAASIYVALEEAVSSGRIQGRLSGSITSPGDTQGNNPARTWYAATPLSRVTRVVCQCARSLVHTSAGVGRPSRGVRYSRHSMAAPVHILSSFVDMSAMLLRGSSQDITVHLSACHPI
jgi:hypothetical protein